MKVSIVIPAYNEKNFILKILEKVDQVNFSGLEKEVLIIDDYSTDGTREILKTVTSAKVIFHSKNLGKGAALATGFSHCSGDIIAIQDADLEYNPHDLVKLVAIVASGQVPIAYGSRMIGNNPTGHYAYYAGNLVISWLARLLYGVKLTDIETCYKVFKKEVLSAMTLSEPGFGFEIQFTVNALKNHFTIKELPITYSPRKFNEGKKISWRDGLAAIWLLLKYRFKQ